MRVVLLGNHGAEHSSENHHARSLEALGHEVIRLQETQASSETVLDESLKSDMFVWIKTHGWETPGQLTMREVLGKLKDAGIPSVSYHLDLWLGLQREKDLHKDDVYKYIEHFFTVDKLMADWFNENTSVKGHFLPAGVVADECVMLDRVKSWPQPTVGFVGSKNYHFEWKYRPQLIEWLEKTYGDNFVHYGGDGLGVVRGMSLNQLYADLDVVIGDTLCLNFDYPEYISDRLFETTGRGGFIIHPYIKGIEKHFELDKELVVYNYGDFDDLKAKIDFYLSHPQERDAIRLAGHNRTKSQHTYTHRWKTILETVLPNGNGV